ncbi:hypothetical protein BGZ50_007088 [Haplosporangium sp. Z 11]|nr:hypothetical protein BGZ50_007088 [Haplosporangium sp. Z 11]
MLGAQDDIFCEMCNGHQRVVYQLLSNYIPDEEDENYDAYYKNADTYRRQLEERYPLACADCLDKVQKALAQQNYKIKTSILNTTLNKSRGGSITPSRKYPSMTWLFAGSSWFIAHVALIVVELCGVFGPNTFPDLGKLDFLRYRKQTSGSLAFKRLAGAGSSINYASLWPWSSSFGRPFVDTVGNESSTLIIVALTILSVIGLSWDPLQFALQRAPRIRIRSRWYYSWVRFAAAPVMLLQFVGLFSGLAWSDAEWHCAIVLSVHLLYLVGFVGGRIVQEPLEFKFSNSSPPPSRPNTAASNRALQGNSNKDMAALQNPDVHNYRPNSLPTLNRSATDPSNNIFYPSGADSPAFLSRPSSPDMNQMKWSPKKPSSLSSTSQPASFGMYRDPGHIQSRDDHLFQGRSQGLGSTGSFLGQGSSVHMNVNSMDNKFRSRAYEPSPLANPSLITNMGLSNMSFGELLGFPSAKFQPPENHFAHRIANGQGTKETDAWSYRKPTEARAFGGNGRRTDHGRSSAHSRFADNGDMDMDDDDDDGYSGSRGLSRRMGQSQSNENDLLSALGSAATTSRSKSGWTVDGREPFAAQTYFPPEPETGLEENFLGVVKIVDDYLPPRQEPRTILGRNLMLKKRMARRWLAIGIPCRCIMLWKTESFWLGVLQSIAQCAFVGVILHATAFWIFDGYRTIQHTFDKNKPTSKRDSKSSKDKDPFEPTKIDQICTGAVASIGLTTKDYPMGCSLHRRPRRGYETGVACAMDSGRCYGDTPCSTDDLWGWCLSGTAFLERS